ncbi:MAG: hypothetical protein OWU32_13215 [Firmicutes bacterium]|nr:hypothetical protein [Bacillota bacterium]
MADLVRTEDTVVLRLSAIDKLVGVHRDIEVPVPAEDRHAGIRRWPTITGWAFSEI